MESKNAKIYVSSVAKISKKLQYYGDINIENISLLKLIYKYACFSSTYSQLQRLDKMVAYLQRVDPDICMEMQSVSGIEYTGPIGVVAIGVEGNTAPVITASAVTLADPNSEYTFSYSDLFSGYSDDAGGVVSSVVFSTLPSNGTLFNNGVAVVAGELISSVGVLTYVRNSDSAYNTSFNYYVYDNNAQLPLASNTVACSVTVEAITIFNAPPTVGDRAQYSGNRTTTVFNLSDFTSQAIAPYFDPEGNDLDAIRIDEVSDANTGVYYYLGSEVVIGQIITAAELNQGAFYHEAPDNNATTTDSFNASVRDNVNMTWVS